MSRGYRVRAGQLRHRGVIQNVVETRNSIGEQLIAFEDIITVWMSIVQIKGNEIDIARQTAPNSTHLIRMRYVPGFTERNRIKLKDPTQAISDRFFNIERINDIDLRQKIMEIEAIEDKTADGDGTAV